MALTSADLNTTFDKDVDWFNADNFPKPPDPVYDRFDDKVAMKKIDDPGGYHKTKPDVADYFWTKGNADKATFKPRKPPGQPVFQIVGSLGFVSGTAYFEYRTVTNADGPPTGERKIAYSFTYTGVSGDWKLIHLWGQYV